MQPVLLIGFTWQKVENSSSGQALANGMNGAMQQSRCSSGNIFRKVYVRQFCYKLHQYPEKIQTLALSFYSLTFGNHLLFPRFV